MPAPLKSSRNLRERFDLYLSPVEIEQVRANAAAARLPMSTFVRRLALGHTIEVPPAAADLARWRELTPLANNINQIARACNAGRVAGIDPAILDAVAEQVRLLRLELLGLRGQGRESTP